MFCNTTSSSACSYYSIKLKLCDIIAAVAVHCNRVCKCQGLLSMYRNLTTDYDLEPPLRDWDAEVKQLVKATSKLYNHSKTVTTACTLILY
jgi:hypothetical protein